MISRNSSSSHNGEEETEGFEYDLEADDDDLDSTITEDDDSEGDDVDETDNIAEVPIDSRGKKDCPILTASAPASVVLPLARDEGVVVSEMTTPMIAVHAPSVQFDNTIHNNNMSDSNSESVEETSPLILNLAVKGDTDLIKEKLNTEDSPISNETNCNSPVECTQAQEADLELEVVHTVIEVDHSTEENSTSNIETVQTSQGPSLYYPTYLKN